MTIIPIHDQQGQIDAANRIIADQGMAIATAHAALLAVKKLNMPQMLKSQVCSAIRVIEGKKS
jgi:hypothetical protein